MNFAKRWLPPALRHAGNRLLGTATTFSGPFETWADATRATTGYAQNDILARVVAATEAVLAGKADYEQDGCSMHGVAPASHALSALLSMAEAGELRVVDFGGGLASHYLRWLPFLAALPVVQWRVVEQPHFVDAGRQLFADVPQVHFVSSLEDLRTIAPHVVLASSVLQYLDSPLTSLKKLASLDARAIVLDRTPFDTETRDQILVQRVPANLGSASYPLRTFARSSIEARLSDRYEKVMEFPSGDAPIRIRGASADYLGQVWMRRS